MDFQGGEQTLMPQASKSGRQGGRIAILPFAAAAVFLIVQIFPLAWIILVSLKTPSEIATGPTYTLPSHFDLSNYVRAFETSGLLTYILNSGIVAALTIGITVALAAPAAFAIEKLRFPGANFVLGLFLLGLMVPIFVSLLPIFQVFGWIGLRRTYWAVVLPQVAFNLPMAIYIYTGFMRNIPDALMEAAAIDGAGPLRIFFKIIVPLSMNATVTIAVFNFMFVWNEFVFANTFLTSARLKTLPIGLFDFVGQYGKQDLGATYAAIVVSVIPTLFLYAFLNRRVVEGMAAGAVKS
jgi:raffinose/stachyose/melibiose transport system permease protein